MSLTSGLGKKGRLGLTRTRFRRALKVARIGSRSAVGLSHQGTVLFGRGEMGSANFFRRTLKRARERTRTAEVDSQRPLYVHLLTWKTVRSKRFSPIGDESRLGEGKDGGKEQNSRTHFAASSRIPLACHLTPFSSTPDLDSDPSERRGPRTRGGGKGGGPCGGSVAGVRCAGRGGIGGGGPDMRRIPLCRSRLRDDGGSARGRPRSALARNEKFARPR